MIYEFTSNTILNLFNIINASDFLYIKISTKNAIAFVNINVKYHYDKHHQSIFFKINDYAFLRLYKEYNILINFEIIKKLSQQYVDFFKILKRVDRFIYHLKVFED